mgnify:FL=1
MKNGSILFMETTTLKGTPVKLAGEWIKVGRNAPSFTLVKNDMSTFSLKEGKGHYLILNIFPSLDTGVCAASVRKFNKIAAKFPDTLVLCISKDLPFAQHRFCVAEGIEHVMTLSDYRYDSSFGKDYGVLITDSIMKGLLARAVVVINPEGRVIYSNLVAEITEEPDYENAISSISDAYSSYY